VTIFGIQHDRIGRSSLTPGRAARRPGHLRGRIQKNSQPSPAARSHRARFVRPLDTGGPYGWVPYIVRQVRHAVVVSAAGCRIGEHLGQRPAEASSGPVTPNRPDVAPRGIPTSISHWVTGKVGENAHRAAVRCASPGSWAPCSCQADQNDLRCQGGAGTADHASFFAAAGARPCAGPAHLNGSVPRVDGGS
jgi:hypothetical protein